MDFLFGSGKKDQTKTAGPADGDLIKESDTQSFIDDVIRASQQVPVIVDFWAPWCGPCKQLGPILEKIVRQAGGQVRMVKVNVDENQELAAQLRVQSIPAVYGFRDGRPVDAFVGALPESQIKAFVDRLTGGAPNPLEQALDIAKDALDTGDAAAAADIYAQVLEQDPRHAGAIGGLIRSYVATGRTDEARRLIDGLPADIRVKSEVSQAVSALELAEHGTGDRAVLEARVAADPTDHQARLDLAMALYGAGRNEAAVEALLEIIRRDRAWNDEAARKQLVKLFDAFGPTDPLTVGARKRLSSILFS